MKRNPINIAISLLLVFIVGLLLFVFQVSKSQVAIVTTFGNASRAEAAAGPHLKLPWPIQKVYHLDQRIQNFETKYEETKLPDQNILLLMVYVGWQIKDPMLFFPKFTGGSISEAEKTLEALVTTAKKEVAGKHPFGDFISADEKQMKLTQIENEILTNVQAQVSSHQYGLEVHFVQIKKIGLPDSVTQSVFDRMQSERQVLISKIQNEGEEAATKIKSGADREAADVLAAADAKSLQIRGEGEAAAMKSLAVLQQNPELANLIMKLTSLEQMLKEKTTLILDQTTPPLDLLQNNGAKLKNP